MKTAGRFHLYVLDRVPLPGLAATGLQTEPLADAAEVEQPALLLLAQGQQPPEKLAHIALEIPPDASPTALRELLKVAMENVVLLPHVGSATRETRVAMGLRALDNLKAFGLRHPPRDFLDSGHYLVPHMPIN